MQLSKREFEFCPWKQQYFSINKGKLIRVFQKPDVGEDVILFGYSSQILVTISIQKHEASCATDFPLCY